MYAKQAAKATIMVFFFSLFASISSYLFRVFLAKELSVAEYGLFYAMFSFFSVFTLFIDVGLGQAVSRQVIGNNINRKFSESKSLIYTTLKFQMTLSFALFCIMILAKDFLMENFFKSNNVLVFLFMGVWFLTLPLVTFLGNIFTGFKRVELTASLELFRQASALILSLLFLHLGFSTKSPFMAYLMINFLMIAFYTPFIRSVAPKFISTKAIYDFNSFWPTLVVGMQLTITGFITTVVTQTDTLMLTLMKGTESVGFYQAAVPMALLVSYASTALTTVAFPIVVEIYSKKENLNTALELVYKYSLMVSVPVAVTIFSYPELALNIMFGPKYLSAVSALKILLIGAFISLITSINNMVLISVGKPKEMFNSMTAAAIANLILNLILIPNYGILGAAAASLFSFAVAMSMSLHRISTFIHLKIPFRKIFSIFISGAVCAILLKFMASIIEANLWIELAIIGTVFFLAYSALLFLLGVITISEIKDLISKMIS